jgi:hypothetical protein
VVNMQKTRTLPRLRLKLFGGPSAGEIFHYDAFDCNTRVVSLGRGKQCVVRIEDSLLSKLQAQIRFDE